MSSQFARKLNLFDATMIVISGIIGSGIFINPYIVAQKVGTPFLILAVWIAGGVFALAGAFVFAELSTVMPKVGGQYAFFREAFHPLVAFLHGWSLMFIIQSGATAGVAVAFAKYLQPLFGFGNELVTPVAIAILLGLASFHALGIKPGAILINVITFGKTLAIAALIVGAFLLTKESGITFQPMAPPNLHGFGLLSAFFAGLVPTMFSYGGWQNLNFVSEEVRDPLRNLPRAILIGVLCVIAVYVSANFAYVHVLGAEALAATETPAADVAAKLAGPFGQKAISFLIVVSTFGFMNLALLSAPRVYYAMGADGVFFKSVGKLSPRFQTPAVAILLQGVLAAVFAISNSYKELVGYAVFADWIFFALAGAALMVFRRTMPDAPRPQPVPLYPLIPILFILFGMGIVINTFITDWKNARIGALIIAAGVPVFFFVETEQVLKNAKRKVAEKLIELVLANDLSGLELLLIEGSDLNSTDDHGVTALMTAAGRGKLDFVRLLLSSGADANIQDFQGKWPSAGKTALMFAANGGHTEIAKVLIANGANVGAQDKEGQTALMEAAFNGQAAIVELLLAAGASVNLQNSEGDTAATLAENIGQVRIIELLKRKS